MILSNVLPSLIHTLFALVVHFILVPVKKDLDGWASNSQNFSAAPRRWLFILEIDKEPSELGLQSQFQSPHQSFFYALKYQSSTEVDNID